MLISMSFYPIKSTAQAHQLSQTKQNQRNSVSSMNTKNSVSSMDTTLVTQSPTVQSPTVQSPTVPSQTTPPQTDPPSETTLSTESLSDKLAEIDAYLEAHAETGRFSGTVLITQGSNTGNSTDNQTPIITRSYHLANREHQVTNTPTTKFRIGSVTKQFTAAAILQLQEKELLDVQAPISTYLPDYPNGDQLTIHHLLTHTAGIPEYLDPTVFPDLEEWLRLSSTVEQLVDRFKDLSLEFEPGEKFKYSNSGYVLLTQIIETVSEQTYADYLQTNLFAPLDMESTGYEIPQTVIPQMAQGYLFLGNDTYLQSIPMDMSLPQGAGGLYSTTADLLKWTHWLHSEKTDTTLLSQESKAALMNPVVQMLPEESPGTFYGYGLVIDNHLGQKRVQHNGGISGFASSLSYYPDENLTIAVLSNLETAPSGQIANDLAAIALNQPYEIPEQKEPIALDPALYEKYIGNYQLLPEMQVEISVDNDQLIAQATGQDSFVLYPTSETEFFAQAVDITVTFSLTETGTVEGFTLTQMGQELFAPKID